MPFGEVDVECSRPRVPLYPYERAQENVICHYSRRRPSVGTRKKSFCKSFDLQTGCSLPQPRTPRPRPNTATPSSRPHTATGIPPVKEFKKEEPPWNGRHHVTGSQFNTKLYPMFRNYFDDLPGEVPQSKRRLPKKQSETAPGGTSGDENPKEDFRDMLQRRRSTAPRNVLGSLLEKQVRHLYICDAIQSVPGLQNFADFYMWCIKKFKNLTRCWRLLDQNLNMKITKLEFLTSLNKYEFHGDARALFNILDRDRSGSLSYYHFDPSGAEELASLQKWIKERFGTVEEAFYRLDEDGDGRITTDELQRGLRRYGFHVEVRYLFEMLDLDRDQKIQPEELLFLDRWTPLPFLCHEPDYEGAETWKQKLLHAYNWNSIKAWHGGLDKNMSMRVSYTEFSHVCQQEHVPMQRRPGVWRAMDTDLSGWISLREVDPLAHELLLKFKKYCVDNYGSVYKAFNKIDLNNNGSWSRREFQKIEHDMNLSREDGEMLFQGLAMDGGKQITFSKVKYLDNWSVEDERRENEFWEAIGVARKKARENDGPRRSDFL